MLVQAASFFLAGYVLHSMQNEDNPTLQLKNKLILAVLLLTGITQYLNALGLHLHISAQEYLDGHNTALNSVRAT